MTRHTLESRLPDINLDPPEPVEQDWANMTDAERIQSILDEFSPREVAEFYVEQQQHIHMLIFLARTKDLDALNRYVAKNRLDE